MFRRHPIVFAVAILGGFGCPGSPDSRPGAADVPRVAADIEARLAEFAPTVIEADLGLLDDTERRVLELVIDASRQLDPVFLRQAHRDNPARRRRLESVPDDAGRAVLVYFDVQAGYYERQHGWRSFVEGTPPRPPGGGYYPADLTRDELTRYVADHPDREAELISLTTVVERRDGELVGIPYSTAFAEWLEPAAARLREAAGITRDESLRRYLSTLADALLSDSYREADMAWMDLGGRIELTLGPYETYEDELLGSKAAFEAFVTLVDPEQSGRVERLKRLLPQMEAGLPIPDEHKNFARGAESPIRVVDLVYSAGDARAGIQTIAFNLPNDEEVRELKGSKKVLLRNVLAAKFDAILAPIAAYVLIEPQAQLLSRERFIDEVLHHELSHGLGPGRITVDGKTAEVREFLLEHYSSIEEAKADVVGIWSLIGMAGNEGALPSGELQPLLTTYVAGLFRSVRFGTASAHGEGAAVQLRLLQQAGAIETDPASGKIRVVFDRFPEAVRGLANRLLMIQARGDHEAAGQLLAEHGELPASMSALIDGLGALPIDIRPIYTVAGESP